MKFPTLFLAVTLLSTWLAAGFSNAAETTGTAASKITIEAWIDGPTEMRVTPTGIYWICRSEKPGRHDDKDEPTYINNKAWKPIWGNPAAKAGADISKEFSFQNDPASTKFRFLIATSARDGKKSETRDTIVTKMVDGQLSIFIPEGQAGACWYKFSLQKDPNAKTSPFSTSPIPAK